MWTANTRSKSEHLERMGALVGQGSADNTADSGFLYEAAFKRWAAAKAKRAKVAGSDADCTASHPSERVIPRFHFGPPPTRDDSFSRVHKHLFRSNLSCFFLFPFFLLDRRCACFVVFTMY